MFLGDGGSDYTITLDANFTASKITFLVPNYTIVPGSGTTLTLNGSHTIDNTVGSSGNSAINAILAGTAGITYTGNGILTLRGANTYSGGSTLETTVVATLPSVVTSGTITSGSLGVGNISIPSGGELDISGNHSSIPNALSIAGTGAGTNGAALFNISGINSYTGPITLTGDTTIGSTNGTLNQLLITNYPVTSTHELTYTTNVTPLVPNNVCLPCQGGDVGTGGNQGGGDSGMSSQMKSGAMATSGMVAFGANNLNSSASGMFWSQEPIWTNMPALATGNTGSGMAGAQLPQLLSVDASTVALTDASNTRWFDLSGGTYSERFEYKDKLTHNGTAHTFALTDSSGQILVFNDFDSSINAAAQGQLIQLTAASGALSTLEYATSAGGGYEVGQLKDVLLETAGGSFATERYLYTYIASGSTNAGLVSNVAYQQSTNGSTWTTARQVAYTYYDGTTSNGGNLGDLEFADVKDASGSTTVDRTYYRYYLPSMISDGGTTIGYVHALRHMFTNASYQRLFDDLGSIPSSISEDEATHFADESLTYDGQHRLTKMITQGLGCSVCSAGLGTFTYSYAQAINSTPSNYNTWTTSTTETFLKDSTTIYTDTYYTNSIGETLVADHHDEALSTNTRTAYAYDSAGRQTEQDSPSSISSFSPNSSTGAIGLTLYSSSGLISVTGYYTSDGSSNTLNTHTTTDASGLTAGGAAGYVAYNAVKHGSSGSQILQDFTTYYLIESSSSGPTTPVVAATSVYSGSNTVTDVSSAASASTGKETTTYGYKYYADTTQIKQQQTTLPSTTADEASSGGDSSYEYFDQTGRTVWTKDAEGFIGYTGYDSATGAVALSIQDISSGEITSDSLTLPSDWSVVSGTRLNLKTQYVVDSQSRVTKEIDPVGNVTYTVYKDSGTASEVRTYRGFYTTGSGGSTAYHITGPIEVSREDYAHQYSESFTMAVTPHLNGSNVPDGGETIGSLRSLSRSILNSAGQVVETDDYYDLTTDHSDSSTWTYDASAQQIGTAWNHSSPTAANYYKTTIQYGDLGQVVKTVNPNMTVTRTVTDSLGRVTSTWIGTDDTPSTFGTYWSPANRSGTDLVELSANVYDVDSNLIFNVQFPNDFTDSASTFRVTKMFYDWRDRLVATKAGVIVSEVTPGTSGSVRIDGLSDLSSSPMSLLDTTSGETTDGVQRAISYSVLDNLSEVTTQYSYAGNGIALSSLDNGGTPSSSYNSSIRAQVDMTYDLQGRAYQTKVWDVIQSGGSAGTHDTSTGNNTATTSVYFTPRGLVDHTTDGMGFETDYGYDSVSRQTAVTLPDPDGTDSGHPLTSPVTTTAYNDTDGSVTVTDPNGHSTTRYFDHAGRLTEILLPAVDILASGTTDASYNPADHITNSTSPILYGYGDDGLLHTVQDQNGNTTTTNHDPLGRTTSVVAPSVTVLQSGDTSTSSASPTATYTYDGDGNTLSVTDGNGGLTSYSYDIYDRLQYVYSPDPSSAGSSLGDAQVTNVYNNLGDLTSTTAVTDASSSLSATTNYTYNSLGQQIQVQQQTITALQSGASSTTSAHPTQSFTYSPLGNLATVTDANSTNASTHYVTAYTYKSMGLLAKVVQADPAGTTSAGPTTTYTYNLNGQPLLVTDPLGNPTSYEYDNDGNRTKVIVADPANGLFDSGKLTTNYAFDPAGNMKSVTTPTGNTTTYKFDARNQVYEVDQPVPGSSGPGPVTLYYHDAAGNMTAEKDPAGYTTFFNRDAMGRLSETRQTVALSRSGGTTTTDLALVSYFYDKNGNLTKKLDANGAVIAYAYNYQNQLTQERWFTSDTNFGSGTYTNTISYTYLTGGGLHTAADAYASGGGMTGNNSKYGYTVNELGWVTSVDNNGGTSDAPGVPRVVLNSQYDLNGNRTALAAAIGSSSGTDDFQDRMKFDALNRPTQVDQTSKSGGYAVSAKQAKLTYDDAGRLTRNVYAGDGTGLSSGSGSGSSSGSGIIGTYTYDHASRLTDLTWSGAGSGSGSGSGSSSLAGIYDEFTWSYYDDSTVHTYTNPLNTSENRTYSYDHDSQLTNAAGTGGSTYTWDLNGNPNASGVVTGAGNRLMYDGTYTYTYDHNGNLLKQTTSTTEIDFTWDIRNRLIDVTNKDSLSRVTQDVSYSYDVFDRLQGRTIVTNTYTGSGPTPTTITTVTARFVFDGPSASSGQGKEMVLAFDGTGAMTDRYLWGPAVDQIFADEQFTPTSSGQLPSTAGTNYWALTDNEGTVRDLVVSQVLNDHLQLDAFGTRTWQSNSSTSERVGYTGAFYDPATGLLHNGARWYKPAIERWLSQDPSGLGPDSNPYRYVGNSPTNYTDPTGLKWEVLRYTSLDLATATAEEGDTISSLADYVGLQSDQFRKWLTLENDKIDIVVNGKKKTVDLKTLKNSDKICPGQEVQVPNHIEAYWLGNRGDASWFNGKKWVDWGKDIRYLKDRGFRVEARNWQDGKGFRDEQFLAMTKELWQTKRLHGLFITGHGWAGGVTSWDDEGFSFDQLSRDYKLAFVILNTCNSGWQASENPKESTKKHNEKYKPDPRGPQRPDSIKVGGADLVADSPGAKSGLTKGMLNPVFLGGWIGDAPTHPNEILKPLEQGTQRE